jgi:stage II sporulation protein GA (sporulation sigma-E factor processing peptidase)
MEEQVRYLYLDELALQVLLNAVADFWLLAATARTVGLMPSRARLFLSSLVGTGYYLVYRLASICLVSPGFPWRSLPVLALVGIAMLVIAFAPLSWRRLANLSAAFMLLAVLAAGMATTVAYLLGDPGQPHWTGGGIAFLVAVPTLARSVWESLHRHAWRRLYQIQVTIGLGGKTVELPALLDTGNQLRDPFLDQPVLVSELDPVRPLLPPAIHRVVESLGRGELTAATALAGSELRNRFRLVPFASLGQDRGLLWALRPDWVAVRTSDGIYEHRKCLVAFVPRHLDADGIYQALVPGALLSPAAFCGSPHLSMPSGTIAHDTRAQGGGTSGHASISPA